VIGSMLVFPFSRTWH